MKFREGDKIQGRRVSNDALFQGVVWYTVRGSGVESQGECVYMRTPQSAYLLGLFVDNINLQWVDFAS